MILKLIYFLIFSPEIRNELNLFEVFIDQFSDTSSFYFWFRSDFRTLIVTLIANNVSRWVLIMCTNWLNCWKTRKNIHNAQLNQMKPLIHGYCIFAPYIVTIMRSRVQNQAGILAYYNYIEKRIMTSLPFTQAIFVSRNQTEKDIARMLVYQRLTGSRS